MNVLTENTSYSRPGRLFKKTSRADRDSLIDISRKALEILFRGYQGRAAIQLWNRQIVIGDENALCRLVFFDAYPLRTLIIHHDLGRLTEIHIKGDVEVEGDAEVFFDLVDFLRCKTFKTRERLRLLQLAASLPGTETLIQGAAGKYRVSNTRASISHHYDVSNEFYRLFLDPEMAYSCAYFSSPGQSLADAQRDKLDYICRKLRLQHGHTLLDIGCGWGSLAIRAAQRYGVKVHGITLSQQQYEFAVDRIRALNLQDRVNIEVRDYRKLPQDILYDRIVSVGMFEHIGVENYPGYFTTIKSLLRPQGLFLNHGITNDSGWSENPVSRFINKFIFPDAELTRVSNVQVAMENAGFEILDVEALRQHYVLTLRNWVKALEYHRESALELAGEATYKLWRLYMAGAAYYFNQGNTGIYQVLACRGRLPWNLPLRRDELYTT